MSDIWPVPWLSVAPKIMSRETFRLLLFTCCVMVLAAMFQACNQSNSGGPAVDSSSNRPSTAASPLTGFQRDLQFIRNGQFTYVWVFSRPDGKTIDKDDAAFLRANAPQVVDWVTTDEGKRVIAGTNFNLEEGPLTAIRKRFVAEDYTGK